MMLVYAIISIRLKLKVSNNNQPFPQSHAQNLKENFKVDFAIFQF